MAEILSLVIYFSQQQEKILTPQSGSRLIICCYGNKACYISNM